MVSHLQENRTFDESDGALSGHAGHLDVHPVAPGSLALEHADLRVVHLRKGEEK